MIEGKRKEQEKKKGQERIEIQYWHTSQISPDISQLMALL